MHTVMCWPVQLLVYRGEGDPSHRFCCADGKTRLQLWVCLARKSHTAGEAHAVGTDGIPSRGGPNPSDLFYTEELTSLEL